MKTVSIQLPETIFAALHKEPNEFVQEMRLAAAIKWYELGEISQGEATEIAGLSRSDFINALSRYKVSPFQPSVQDQASVPTTVKPRTQLSLRQVATMPKEERHKLIADSIPSTAEDFLNNPDLMEFAVLDGEDWDLGNDY